MPYDPTPSGDEYFTSVKWDERGNPYQLTASGKRQYIPPAAAATADEKDPVGVRLRSWAAQKGSTYDNPGGAYPEGGFASNRGTWDGESGTFDGGNFFNTSLGGLILGGGAIAAPYVGAALAGSAGPNSVAPVSSGVSSGAGLVGAGTSATTAAEAATAAAATPGLASTTIGAGYIPAITGGTGSAVSGAAAAGGIPSYLKAVNQIGNTASDIAGGRAQGRAVEAGLTDRANNTEIGLYRSIIDSNNAQNQYGLQSANAENNFNANNYGLDLNRANAENNFGLGKVNAGIGIGNLDLAQKRYALEAPGARAGQAVRGDILANAQDAKFNLPSTIPQMSISGGLRPSMFSANTRALGGELSASALANQRKGDTFAPLPTLPNYQWPTSALPTYKAPAPYVNPPKPPTLTPQPQANGFDTALGIAGYAGLAAPYLKYFL